MDILHFKAEKYSSINDFVLILSTETLDFHYSKHHVGYANNLNSLIKDTEYLGLPLEDIVKKSRGVDQKIFNNAGQLFNHNFYWKCLKKDTYLTEGKLKKLIKEQFSTVDNFLNQYVENANKIFGSGWSWVIVENDEISFLNTQNAENPIGSSKKPIAVIDLWEHAYYIDYRNDRLTYLNKIIKECLNWPFLESQI